VVGKRVVIATHSGTAIEKAIADDLAELTRSKAKKVVVSDASASDIVLLAGCGGVTPECMRSSLASLKADVWLVVEEDGPIVKVIAVDGDDSAEHPIDPQDPAASDKLGEAAGLQGESGSDTQSPDTETDTDTDTQSGDTDTDTDTQAVVPALRGGSGSDFDIGRVRNSAWITMAVGGGLTLFGLTLHLIADGKQDEVDQAPTDALEDFEALEELEDSGRRYNRWGNIFTISGVAVGLAGIGLGLYQALSSDDEPPVEVTPTKNGVQVRWSF
ncbi:MAG: hypothetical protein KJO07_14335, partial [Deltaproteobacteria bacterium]|nr:hypothetical protein [Deltaproteobacteria bacterium]